jgi:hypothetical protein
MPNFPTFGLSGQMVNRANASGRYIFVALLLSACGWAQTPVKPLATLTSADLIRRLTPEQAELGYPVRLRGVITMAAPAPDFFIQDAKAGIFVEGNVSFPFPHIQGE